MKAYYRNNDAAVTGPARQCDGANPAYRLPLWLGARVGASGHTDSRQENLILFRPATGARMVETKGRGGQDTGLEKARFGGAAWNCRFQAKAARRNRGTEGAKFRKRGKIKKNPGQGRGFFAENFCS